MTSSHDYREDKRNKRIKIYINGKYYQRDKAKISVFDSSVLLGDGCWDSLRFHNNKFIFLNEHIKRLYKDAKLINLKIHLSQKELIKAIYKTITINKMPTDPTFCSIIKQIRREKLSPFDVQNNCECIKPCLLAILNPENKRDLLCREDIGNLFCFLIENGYKIEYKITKIIKKKNLICFIRGPKITKIHE